MGLKCTLYPTFRLQPGYIANILLGVARYLQYRFDCLRSPTKWEPIQPEPNGYELAKKLLYLVERYTKIWKYDYIFVQILNALSHVFLDIDSTNRLVFLLYLLVKHPNHQKKQELKNVEKNKEVTVSDIRSESINSIKGIAAWSAIKLCNRLLKHNKDLPELLFPLLSLYARDPVESVRAALMDDLPYLAQKNYSWARQLFDTIFSDHQTHLWSIAERFMYYFYDDHFDHISIYLDKMKEESTTECLNAWGRLITLVALSGHINQSELFKQLETKNSIVAWEGACQVFSANIDKQKHRKLCTNGITYILKLNQKSNRLLRIIEKTFELEKKSYCLDYNFAYLFIDAIEPGIQSFYFFFEWIADLSHRDPIEALSICEKFIQKCFSDEFSYKLWGDKKLIDALSNILREADETDDEKLINRAVYLQDQFLRMDISGIEDFFEMAGRV
ncbi:hypothetical protein MHK_007427 [Candidatus Magnetomorum sp. HK-1]|nr:hypothetical protein MHK_007427 [Candidatus Magnetomorum sp. HK-1]